MKVAVAVLPNGMINAHFGSAKKVALVNIESKEITSWEEVTVPFAETHGDEGHDHHHDHDHEHDHDHHHHHHHHHAPGHVEGIMKFLVDQKVDLVLLDHAGPSIQKIRKNIEIKLVVGASGNAREAVQALIEQGFTD